MRILFLGQLIGRHGLDFVKQHLKELKAELQPDLVIAPADAVTGGFCLGRSHAFYLRKLGVDLLVGGESLFIKRELVEDLANLHFIVRPANFPGQANLGYSTRFIKLNDGRQLNIINVMGQLGHHRIHAANPYLSAQKALQNLKGDTTYTLVTFSAIASAEKQTLGHLLAGGCSAVIGYGAKAMTYDAQIIKDHTAFITDAGRISATNSVAGLNPKQELLRYTTQRPMRQLEAEGQEVHMQALLIEVNATGKAASITPICKNYALKQV